MKFKDIQPGEAFTVCDEDYTTIFIKTTILTDHIVHGNCIIVHSDNDKISVHKGELAWFSDNADVIQTNIMWGYF